MKKSIFVILLITLSSLTVQASRESILRCIPTAKTLEEAKKRDLPVFSFQVSQNLMGQYVGEMQRRKATESADENVFAGRGAMYVQAKIVNNKCEIVVSKARGKDNCDGAMCAAKIVRVKMQAEVEPRKGVDAVLSIDQGDVPSYVTPDAMADIYYEMPKSKLTGVVNKISDHSRKLGCYMEKDSIKALCDKKRSESASRVPVIDKSSSAHQ